MYSGSVGRSGGRARALGSVEMTAVREVVEMTVEGLGAVCVGKRRRIVHLRDVRQDAGAGDEGHRVNGQTEFVVDTRKVMRRIKVVGKKTVVLGTSKKRQRVRGPEERVGSEGSAAAAEGEALGRAVIEEAVAMSGGRGRPRYETVSGWDERLMREALRKLGRPELKWRYGDG